MQAVRSGVIIFISVRCVPVSFLLRLTKVLGESVTGRIFALDVLQGRVHSPLCTLTLLLSRELAGARAETECTSGGKD